MQGEARLRGLFGLVSEQSRYNLACRQLELEVIPSCRHYGMGLLTYSPLDGGLLAGHSQAGDGKGRRAKPSLPIRDPKFAERVAAYEALCERYGMNPADVALAWVLANPRRHGADRGSENARAPRRLDEGSGSHASAGNARRARPHLPGPGRRSPRGLRLVRTLFRSIFGKPLRMMVFV